MPTSVAAGAPALLPGGRPWSRATRSKKAGFEPARPRRERGGRLARGSRRSRREQRLRWSSRSRTSHASAPEARLRRHVLDCCSCSPCSCSRRRRTARREVPGSTPASGRVRASRPTRRSGRRRRSGCGFDVAATRHSTMSIQASYIAGRIRSFMAASTMQKLFLGGVFQDQDFADQQARITDDRPPRFDEDLPIAVAAGIDPLVAVVHERLCRRRSSLRRSAIPRPPPRSMRAPGCRRSRRPRSGRAADRARRGRARPR